MNETRTLCDVKDCKNLATHFSFFKDRRADAAGGMENWNYGFDLCSQHQSKLLNIFLKAFEKTQGDILMEYLRQLHVSMREE